MLLFIVNCSRSLCRRKYHTDESFCAEISAYVFKYEFRIFGREMMGDNGFE